MNINMNNNMNNSNSSNQKKTNYATWNYSPLK